MAFVHRNADWCDFWRSAIWFASERNSTSTVFETTWLPLTHCWQGEVMMGFCHWFFFSCDLGMHHGVIIGDQPYGLPLAEKIMPQHLKPLGYRTHIVGKVSYTWVCVVVVFYFSNFCAVQSSGMTHYFFFGLVLHATLLYTTVVYNFVICQCCSICYDSVVHHFVQVLCTTLWFHYYEAGSIILNVAYQQTDILSIYLFYFDYIKPCCYCL